MKIWDNPVQLTEMLESESYSCLKLINGLLILLMLMWIEYQEKTRSGCHGAMPYGPTNSVSGSSVGQWIGHNPGPVGPAFTFTLTSLSDSVGIIRSYIALSSLHPQYLPIASTCSHSRWLTNCSVRFGSSKVREWSKFKVFILFFK